MEHEGTLINQTSNPDFIFSIKDSMFASWCVFFGGAVILTGMWSRPTDRTVEFRPLIRETWCRGDDGGLSSVSEGLFNSVISSSRAALFEAIKSPNLKPKRFGIKNYLTAILGSFCQIYKLLIQYICFELQGKEKISLTFMFKHVE